MKFNLKLNRKKAGLLVLAIGFFVSQPSFAEVAMKLGWVDIQKAIESTSSGKKMKKALDKEAKKLKKSLRKKEEDIKKMSEDLEKKKNLLSESVLRQKQGEFQNEMLEYRELAQKSSLTLQQKQQELLAPIEKVMQKTMEKISKEGGYDMVFQKGTPGFLLWAKADHDLTDKVVKAYEKLLKKSKK